MAFSDSEIEKISTVSSDGKEFVTMEEFRNQPPKNWTYIPDTDGELLGGYYYYMKPLPSGHSTNALIDSINTYFETKEENAPYEVIVYAESVQTIDKDGESFGDDWQGAWEEFLRRK